MPGAKGLFSAVKTRHCAPPNSKSVRGMCCKQTNQHYSICKSFTGSTFSKKSSLFDHREGIFWICPNLALGGQLSPFFSEHDESNSRPVRKSTPPWLPPRGRPSITTSVGSCSFPSFPRRKCNGQTTGRPERKGFARLGMT